MGKRTRAFFEEADRLGGLVARMRLASLAQVTSTEAAAADDNSPIADRLHKAMPTLQKEFAGSAGQPTSSAAPSARGKPGVIAMSPRGDDTTHTLRTYLTTTVDLISQRDLMLDDLTSTVRRITEAASAMLQVQRASVWFLNATRDRIECADLYDASAGGHSAGVELLEQDFGAYFEALRTERTIAAHDAHKDPRTSCFSEPYLTPLRIQSLIDVPIWVGGIMVGVICCEQVGIARTWNADEETFAYLLSNFVALALERKRLKGEPIKGR
jgi:hypothetical protein